MFKMEISSLSGLNVKKSLWNLILLHKAHQYNFTIFKGFCMHLVSEKYIGTDKFCVQFGMIISLF